MKVTPHQARYCAEELLCRRADEALGRLSHSLLDTRVELNPHQIDAALFALQNPLQQGVLLADEVGLGKTIEAGLVLCQLWAERKRRLLVVCPASLRKQWAQEMVDKFALPTLIADATVLRKSGLSAAAFLREQAGKAVLVVSYPFAVKHEEAFLAEAWDMVVLDEAHKLRNAHQRSNRSGQALRRAFAGRQKLLLTATPLQNSLMELYGLSTLLDEHLFGDEKSFRKSFVQQPDTAALKARLASFVKRTLRRDVLEYVRYTERHALTQRFTPTDAEQALYERISAFLQRGHSYALPKQQQHLTGLILRKLLASSPQAVAATLTVIRERLRKQQLGAETADLLAAADWGSDYAEVAEEAAETEADTVELIDHQALAAEIAELDGFIAAAQALTVDSKALALLDALQLGFAEMERLGAPRKALVFTESRRTQQFLFDFLQQAGYAVVMFSGENNDAAATAVYERWKAAYAGSDRISGSPQVDRRSALIDCFRDEAQVMIATEAAAEGVNLQFCSLVINYDLPWNPQRIEQRIGRCHRYGQQFDVVVINFLNERNDADRRVLELLSDKFRLFSGVFGASDDILGKIEAGIDLEQRIAAIYDRCRSPAEIARAFDDLQRELEDEISRTLAATQDKLLDNFDVDVHERLKLRHDATHAWLDKITAWFWRLTHYALAGRADFDEQHYRFTLHRPPSPDIAAGEYRLLRDNDKKRRCHDYRPGHPLGLWCIRQSVQAATPDVSITFDYSGQRTQISALAAAVGQSGWLRLDKLHFHNDADDFATLLFTACNDHGEALDDDFCRKLLSLDARVEGDAPVIPPALAQAAETRIAAATEAERARNHTLWQQESERIDRWAQDKIDAAQHAIEETTQQINQAQRDKRQATTDEALLACEETISRLTKQRKRQRREIDEVEDDISARRDALIDDIRKRLQQSVTNKPLFTLRWRIT